MEGSAVSRRRCSICSDEIDVTIAGYCRFERDPCAVRGPSTDRHSSGAQRRDLPKSAPIASATHTSGLLNGATRTQSGCRLVENRAEPSMRVEFEKGCDSRVSFKARVEIHQMKVDVAGDRLKRRAGCPAVGLEIDGFRAAAGMSATGDPRAGVALLADSPQPTGWRLVDVVDDPYHRASTITRHRGAPVREPPRFAACMHT